MFHHETFMHLTKFLENLNQIIKSDKQSAMENIFKRPARTVKKFKTDEPKSGPIDNSMRGQSKDADPVDDLMVEQPIVEAGQVDLQAWLEKKLLEASVDLNEKEVGEFANLKIKKTIKNIQSQVKGLVEAVSEFYRSKMKLHEQPRPETSSEPEGDEEKSDLTFDEPTVADVDLEDLSSGESSDGTRYSDYDLGGSSTSSQSTGSSSKTPKTKKTNNTGFSHAKTAELEKKLELKEGGIRKLRIDEKPNVESMFKEFLPASDELIKKSYERLRNSLRTKRFPKEDEGDEKVSEALKSCHMGQVLDEINLHFLNEFNVEQEHLSIMPKWPVAWLGYGGRIDYAVFRTGKKENCNKLWKKMRKRYFYLVEMKSGNPLLGLNQGMAYLSKLKKKDKNASQVGLFGYFSEFS